MINIALLPFGAPCPKCAAIRPCCGGFCRGCDDWIEAEHLHIQCSFCGFIRMTKCADTPVEPVPQQDPPGNAGTSAQEGPNS